MRVYNRIGTAKTKQIDPSSNSEDGLLAVRFMLDEARLFSIR